MHPNPLPRKRSFPTAARLLCPALFLCGAVALAADAPAGGKMYTLFQGDNISVGQGTDVYPVRDVNGRSWVIVVDGKEVLVSANLGPIAMKVTPLQKLTEVSATLSNMKAERGYTFMNDPAVRLTKGMSQTAQTNAGYAASVSQATAAQNVQIQASQMGVNRTSATVGTSPATNGDQQSLASSQQTLNAAAASAGSDLFPIDTRDTTGDFDALNVSFEISSDTPLNVPYLVTMTRFHERGAPEGSYKNLVYAKAIDPVSSKVTKVEFEQDGFPLGYTLEGFEVHLYDQGREVATNVSPKRQVLTSDQAFDYVRARYIEAHKGQTLTAVPVMGNLPDGLAAQVTAGKYSQPFFVKVSGEGTASEAYSDLACKDRIVDAYLDSVVRTIRFKPALSAGEPVEGVAMVDLSHLKF